MCDHPLGTGMSDACAVYLDKALQEAKTAR